MVATTTTLVRININLLRNVIILCVLCACLHVHVVVSMKLNYPQILVDVNFLLAISELASSYSKPFSSSQQLVSGADNMTIKSDEQSNVGGIEDSRSSSSGSIVKVTMRVSQPRVVLLEDTEKSETAAVMVLQVSILVLYHLPTCTLFDHLESYVVGNGWWCMYTDCVCVCVCVLLVCL